MENQHSFKFLDGPLNSELIRRLGSARIDHSVSEDGVVHYSGPDQEFIENDLIASIRAEVFPAWQVLSCSASWASLYRDYMNRRAIPFVEELSDGELWFLLPRSYRPHRWKLEQHADSKKMVEIGRR